MQDELFSDLVATDELYAFLMLILKHYASITIYIIEPYVAQNKEVLKIPAGEKLWDDLWIGVKGQSN